VVTKRHNDLHKERVLRYEVSRRHKKKLSYFSFLPSLARNAGACSWLIANFPRVLPLFMSVSTVAAQSRIFPPYRSPFPFFSALNTLCAASILSVVVHLLFLFW